MEYLERLIVNTYNYMSVFSYRIDTPLCESHRRNVFEDVDGVAVVEQQEDAQEA